MKEKLIKKFLEGQNNQEDKKSWLNNITSPLREKLGNKWRVEANDANFKAFQFYKKFFNDEDFDVIELVAQLVEEGDKLYAISCLDHTILLYRIIEGAEPSRTVIKYKRQILTSLREYIANVEHDVRGTNPSLNDLRNRITKSALAKIDGSQALIQQIGKDNFIRYAIEQSYFFAPELVWERREEMIKAKEEGKALPARKTTKDDVGTYYQQGSVFVDQGNRYAITIDADGNKEVRALIKSLTGFTVCEGAESVFQNYTISHIWGRAFDPRYFTSLWNIVMVPTWANGLLDKNRGALETKLKTAFMTICRDLYKLESSDWNAFWGMYNMCCPEAEGKEYFRCKTKYRLNIIQRKPETGKKNKNGQKTQYQSLVAPIIKVNYPLTKKTKNILQK